MPAGLLAMMLGSSLEAAAPAKALPSAEALFSRIWNPDPQASPKNASAVVPTATPIASHLTQSVTASPATCRHKMAKRNAGHKQLLTLFSRAATGAPGRLLPPASARRNRAPDKWRYGRRALPGPTDRSAPDVNRYPPKVRFAPNSPLEGDGFELSVPRPDGELSDTLQMEGAGFEPIP